MNCKHCNKPTEQKEGKKAREFCDPKCRLSWWRGNRNEVIVSKPNSFNQIVSLEGERKANKDGCVFIGMRECIANSCKPCPTHRFLSCSKHGEHIDKPYCENMCS